MKQLEMRVSDEGGEGRVVRIPFEPGETVRVLIERIDQQADVDGYAVMEQALGQSAALDESKVLADFEWASKPLTVRRVCVEVHFETEMLKHSFPVQSKWARVHRWACKAFSVAEDACANLELHDGTATGPAINERQEIGASKECKVVWLVKPGPEPNG